MKILGKLICGYIIIVLLFGAAMTLSEYQNKQREQQNLVALYTERGLLIAKLLDAQVETEQQLNSPGFADAMLKHTVDADIGAKSFSILALSPPEKNYPAGVWFIATNEPGRKGAEGDPQDKEAITKDEPNVIFDEVDGVHTMEVSAPLHDKSTGKAVGIVGITFSLEKLDALLVVQKPFVLTMIISILAIVIAFYIATRLTQPLKQLTTVANELSKGNIEVKMPTIRTKDEINDLNESIKCVLAAVEFLTDEVKKKEEKREGE